MNARYRKSPAGDQRSELDHLSARIKEVYIELNDYAYFHGPSEVDRLDRRFTGRRDVLERLKSLLTDHESPSGAYLVTGFRGAGKSSLVAKALAEITQTPTPWIGGRRVLRIAAPVAVCSLVKLPFLGWVTAVLLVASALLVGYLAATDPRRQDLFVAGARRWAKAWALLCSGLRAFVLEPDRPPSGRLRCLWQDILMMCVLTLATLTSTSSPGAAKAFWATLAVVLVGCVPPVLMPMLAAFPRALGAEERKCWWREQWKAIRCLPRPSRRVHFKVNLSQDDLKEIDILRMIASGLETEYRAFARMRPLRLAIRFLLLSPFLILAGFAYEGLLRDWAKDLKTDLHVPCYLPSQGAFLLATPTDYWTAIEERRTAADPELGSGDLRRRLEILANQGSGGAKRGGAVPFAAAEAPHAFQHPQRRHTLAGRLQAFGMNAMTHVDTLAQILASRLVLEPVRGTAFERTWTSLFKVSWPTRVDYLFVAVLMLGWWLPPLALRRFMGRLGHRDILKSLTELNEMIDAEVTQERGALPMQASTWLSVGFGRRRSRTFTVLTERDIEKRLLEILRSTQWISPLEVRPDFVVVIDELDKIQNRQPGSPANPDLDAARRPGGKPAAGEKRHIASIDADRGRQQRILALVSNLKHFLSTAPAKFVFIAGREMFDAALADVSDREFFMGSIFNEVVHVPSFHSDNSDGRLPDITSLPEEYLCRFLLPASWHYPQPCLQLYRKYLQEVVLPSGSAPERILEEKRNKILYELHNFVTYLTYRSNGAPKKVTSILERFVRRLPPDAFEDDSKFVVAGRSSKRLYLRFSYYDQYAFGLVTYLASPLIFSVNRAIKDYGDKILVSSSFVLDHIFKFHGDGFSWRNLELLPEVVDINRAPQLRELLGHIMRFLSRGHINEIVSGLYQFKFTRRITEEINILSKLSEHESAAFNFTLDESLALKRHFYQQLMDLLEKYQGYPNRTDSGSYVNSVAFLRMILGDLHYYDGEYDSALVEYMEAVQQLRRFDEGNLKPDTLILLTRNFLKLGLTFERKKSFDSALLTYGRVADLISRVARREEWVHRSAAEGSEGASKEAQPRSFLRSLRYLPAKWRAGAGKAAGAREPRALATGPAEKGEGEAGEAQAPEPGGLIHQVEGIRLLYQPMFARLQIAEKSTLGGISFADLDRMDDEFEHLVGASQDPNHFLLKSEYHAKLGDILFFKNGPMPRQGTAFPKACCASSGALCLENEDREDLIAMGRRLPCLACHHYNRSLQLLCERYLEIEDAKLQAKELLPAILASFDSRSAEGRVSGDRSNFLRQLAAVLSDCGDTYVSCARVPSLRVKADGEPEQIILEKGLLEDLNLILEMSFEPGSRRDRGGADPRRRSTLMSGILGRIAEGKAGRRPKLEEALAYYVVASIVYRESSDNRAVGIQLTKILWVLREFASVAHPDLSKNEEHLTQLGRLTIRELHRSHEGTHRLEIAKLKEVKQEGIWDRLIDQEKVELSRLSINANIPEVLVLIREIQLIDMEVRQRQGGSFRKAGGSAVGGSGGAAGAAASVDAGRSKKPEERIEEEALRTAEFLDAFQLEPSRLAPLEDLCSPYGMFHSVYARIHMLRLRSRIHVKNLVVSGLGRGLRPLFRKRSETVEVTAKVLHPALERAFTAFGEARRSVVPEGLEIRFHQDLSVSDERQTLQYGLELFEMMIVDAIFCCHEIVRLLRIYGRSFMASHSMKAAAHQELARWCDVLNGYLRFAHTQGDPPSLLEETYPSRMESLEARLKEVIGAADMVHLSPSFHRETALRHLKAAIETHSEGLAYEELIEDMTYLNDDFADQLEHFCAALERFRINSGYVDHKILQQTELLGETSIYHPKQYYPVLGGETVGPTAAFSTAAFPTEGSGGGESA